MVWLAVTPVGKAGFVGARGQRFQAAGGLVVDLVAVHVHQLVVLFGQRDGEIQRGHAVFPRELEVRNRAHAVRAHAHRVLHQPAAVRIALNALLREGDDLQRHNVLQLVAQLEQRLHGRELRVGHVHVRADVLNAACRVQAHRAVHALAHVRLRQLFLSLRPAFDALKQRSGLVPHRVARGQAGVQMHMALDQRRQRQTAPEVPNVLAGFRREICADFGKFAVFHSNVAQLRRVFDIQIPIQHFAFPPAYFLRRSRPAR